MYYVYILTSNNSRVLYVGFTQDLKRRVKEHKRAKRGFTGKYNINRLMYYEIFESKSEAMAREMQLKSGSRKKKEELIDKANRNWVDLYRDL